MLKNLNATNKGLITGLVMIGISLGIFYSGQPFDSSLQYLIYIVYAAGIVWTIREFSKSEENTNKFGALFLQGFKCFIVITLLMVIFTFVFNKLHPEFKEEMVKAYNEELVKKGNSTPAEILKNIESAKDYYLTMLISGAIFGYLAIGAVITAATSLLFMKRK
jgi:mannitol-specific phosphotransferase system IIBC component